MNRRCAPPAGVLLVLAGSLVTATLFHPTDVGAAKFGVWSAPVNLGAVVNTGYLELAPQTSKNGLSLYFASDRPESYGSFGGEDLWVSQRSSTGGPWALPMNLGQAINTEWTERSPAFSRDGHYLFFASDRPGGLGGLDIWVSWRANSHDDFGWEAPVNVAVLNSASTDAGPTFFEGGDAGVPLLYMASNRPGGPLDIYVSELLNGAFRPPMPVLELNTAQADLTPGVRHDGLEIVIATNRPGGAGGNDLWVATRPDVGAPWSTPVNLGVPINSGSGESFPIISADRRSLFFTSSREGGGDLYVSTRTR